MRGPTAHRSDSSIFRLLATKAIDVLVFAGNNKLQSDDRVRIANEIIARSPAPREIVGKMILVRAIAAQRELHIGLEKETLVTQRTLTAENSVIRTGAEREIMPVNSALRRAREFRLR